MSNRNENAPRPRDAAFTSTFALLSAAMACAVVLLAVPRPVPFTLPALELPAAEVRSALAQDRQLAERAPRTPAAAEMYALLLAAGEQELGRQAQGGPWQYRVVEVVRRAVAEVGESGLRALRARASQRFMAALAGELQDAAEVRGLCGGQRDILIQHGYLSAQGRLLAPELSVRATYKARWNMIFGRAPNFDLSAVERAAYEGFRALEARNMPADQRGAALLEFVAVGGVRAEQALAIWRAQNGDGEPLLELARSSNAASTELRLRNMAVSVVSARRDGSE